MIYDLTQIFNELDLLEIRLNILDPYVDYFVIGESTQTFSGKDKPLYYEENKERFKQWEKRIIHVVIPRMETDNVFERTAFQKDYLRTALTRCAPDDIIIYGDVDEIVSERGIRTSLLIGIDGKMQQLNYCYYLNMRSSEEWQGTNIFKYKNIRNINEIRADHSRIIEEGGWHFTNMGGVEQIKKKLAAYDHQEMVNDEVYELLEERVENGEDYLGRKVDWLGKPFILAISDVDLPPFLCYNREKYKHLFK